MTAVGWRSIFCFYHNGPDCCDRHAPSEIDSDLDATHTKDILPDNVSINLATNVAQMSEPGKIQLQGAVAMYEDRHTISYKLNCGSNFHDECRWSRISTLTFIGLAFAAAFARMARIARHMKSTNAAGFPHDAGRNQSWLMHSIDRYQWLRHTYPLKVKQVAGRWCEAGAAPGWECNQTQDPKERSQESHCGESLRD
jgi:hypothetical protein